MALADKAAGLQRLFHGAVQAREPCLLSRNLQRQRPQHLVDRSHNRGSSALFPCRLASQLADGADGSGLAPAVLEACIALAEHLAASTLLSAATRVRMPLCMLHAGIPGALDNT